MGSVHAVLESCRERLQAADRLGAVLDVVRVDARALLAAQGATVVLREGDKCFYADEDSIAPLWKGQRFPMQECISGWAMLHRTSAVVPDVWLDPRIPQEAYRPTFVRSLVMVPVGRREPVGAIGVYWSRARTAQPGEVADLEQLAQFTADAFERVGMADAPWAPTFR